MNTWIVILFGILIVIEGWNAYSLYRIKNLAKDGISDSQDEKYYDLKYKFQLYAAIGTLVVFLFAFFQWDTKDGIKKDFEKELEPVRDSLVVVKRQVQKLNNDVQVLDENVQKNPRFHIIIDKEVVRGISARYDTIYFQSCKDELGNKMRKFTTPPIVNFYGASFPHHGSATINEITKDFVAFIFSNMSVYVQQNE